MFIVTKLLILLPIAQSNISEYVEKGAKMIKSPILILFILLIFVTQSCLNNHTLPICSHPWLVVGFSSEFIGTQTGDIQIQRNNEFIIQLGFEPFDSIAIEYLFVEMEQMYASNQYPTHLYEEYGVYPMNVFLVSMLDSFQRIDCAMNLLEKHPYVLYTDQVSCTKTRCVDTLSSYKPK